MSKHTQDIIDKFEKAVKSAARECAFSLDQAVAGEIRNERERMLDSMDIIAFECRGCKARTWKRHYENTEDLGGYCTATATDPDGPKRHDWARYRGR